MNSTNEVSMVCPVPQGQYEKIVMGHGSGGRLASDLLQKVFLSTFNNRTLHALEDQAKIQVEGATIAFTTDSFVVQPIFFPGGDIGKLAIYGTINDLAVGGAKPLFVSAAFILEEGLDVSDLKKIVHSMQEACEETGTTLVAGDTKVVDRGKGDKIFITTSGIGVIPQGISLSISIAKPGDCIILSGSIGDHGMAVMSVREDMGFESSLQSDCASLLDLIQTMLKACPTIRAMRDPTRGGLASTLNEIASASRTGVKIDQRSIPVLPAVSAACEILGLDPLYVANEGKLVAIVPATEAEGLLKTMRAHPKGQQSAIIGQIVSEHPGIVLMRSVAGGERVVPLLAGEQLPRIC